MMDYGVIITMSAIGAAPTYTGGPFVSGVAKLSSAPVATFDAGRLQSCSEVEKVANLQEGGALTSVSRATVRVIVSKTEWEAMKAASANVIGATVQIGRISGGSLSLFCTMRVVDRSWSSSVLELSLESFVAKLADTKIPATTYDDVKYPLIRRSDIGFAGPIVYGHAQEVRAVGVSWDDDAALLPFAVMGRTLAADTSVEPWTEVQVGPSLLSVYKMARVVSKSGSQFGVMIGTFSALLYADAALLSEYYRKALANQLTGQFLVVAGDNAGLAIDFSSTAVTVTDNALGLRTVELTVTASAEAVGLLEIGDAVAYIETEATLVVSASPYTKVVRMPYVERNNAFRDLGGWLRNADGTLRRAIGSSNTGAEASKRWRRIETTEVEFTVSGDEAADIFDYDFYSRQWLDPLAANYGFPAIQVDRKFGVGTRAVWQKILLRAHVAPGSFGTGPGRVRTFLSSSGGELFTTPLPTGTPGATITHRICAADGSVLSEYSRSPGFWESTSGDLDEGGVADVMSTGPFGYASFSETGTRVFDAPELSIIGYFEVELRFLVEILPADGFSLIKEINVFDLCLGILDEGEDTSTLAGNVGRSVVYVDVDGTTALPELFADEHITYAGLLLDPARVAADILYRHGGVTGQIDEIGGVFLGGVKDACTDLMSMAGVTTTEGVAATVSLVEQTTVAKVVNDLASDFGLVIAESADASRYEFKAFLARMGEADFEYEVLPTEILETPAASLQTTSVRDLVNEPVFKFDLTYASGFRQVAKVVNVDADPDSVTPENINDYSVGLPSPLNVFAWDVGNLSYRNNGVKRSKTIELRTVRPASIEAALGGQVGTSRLEYLASVLDIQVLAVADSHACFNALPGDRVRYASREHTDDTQTLATVMAVKFLPETGAVKLALIVDPERFDEQGLNYADSLGATYPTIVDTLNSTLDNGVDTLEV